MIVTIDGPAGAGKSSAARALARRLGFLFLDTGAMYRAVTLAAVRRQVDWRDPDLVARLASEIRLELAGDVVRLDGEDVTAAIRTSEITRLTRHVADNPAVRRLLVERQREFARQGDVVSEGRDQATVAFPAAECKIYLTAGPEERARRRLRDLLQKGEQVAFEEVLRRQEARDQGDFERPVGGLCRAPDAIEVATDGLTPQEVVDRLEALVRARMPSGPSAAGEG